MDIIAFVIALAAVALAENSRQKAKEEAEKSRWQLAIAEENLKKLKKRVAQLEKMDKSEVQKT